jgi:hypothetical protein
MTITPKKRGISAACFDHPKKSAALQPASHSQQLQISRAVSLVPAGNSGYRRRDVMKIPSAA